MRKRVNIGLNEDIHTQAKIISTLKKIPLGEYLEKAIGEAIKKDKKIFLQCCCHEGSFTQ